MRNLTLLVAFALLTSIACKKPNPYSMPIQELPIEVVVKVNPKAYSPGSLPIVEREFAMALRTHLAQFVTVVEEGTTPPPNTIRLNVKIDKNPISEGSDGPSIAKDEIYDRELPRYVESRVHASIKDYREKDPAYISPTYINPSGTFRRMERGKYGYNLPRVKGSISLTHLNEGRLLFSNKIPTKLINNDMNPILDKQPRMNDIYDEMTGAFGRVITKELQHTFNWKQKAFSSQWTDQ